MQRCVCVAQVLPLASEDHRRLQVSRKKAIILLKLWEVGMLQMRPGNLGMRTPSWSFLVMDPRYWAA